MRGRSFIYVILLSALSLSYLSFLLYVPKAENPSIEVIAPLETQKIFSSIQSQLEDRTDSDLVFSYLSNSSLVLTPLRHNTDRLIWIFPDLSTVKEFRQKGHLSFDTCIPIFNGQLGLFDTRVVSTSSNESTNLEEIYNRISQSYPLHDALLAPDPFLADSGYAFLKALNSIEDKSLIGNYLKIIGRYEASERHMLKRVLEEDKFSAITTLDAVKSAKLEERGIFRTILPNQGLTYQACFLGKLGEDSFKKAFREFFASPAFIATRNEFGFLPPQSEISGQSTIDQDMPGSHHNGSVLSILRDWEKIRKPVHTILLIDSSASLEGHPLQKLKSGLKNALLGTNPHNQFSVVTFQSDVSVALRTVSDRSKILGAIEALQANGGSAVYDGLVESLKLVTDTSPLDYEIKLVLLADGDDTNSTASFNDTYQKLIEAQNSHLLSVIVIAIKSGPESNFDVLSKLAQSLGALFIETSPSRIESAIRQALFD